MISSIQPYSFSTVTASSMRIGCVTASCTPAKRLLSTGCAARPSDDAGNAGGRKQADAVLAHRVERHQREADGDQDDDGIEHAHQHAHLGDVLARQQIVFDVEAETQQVEGGGDIERSQRDPAEQADGRQQQARASTALVSGSSGVVGSAMASASSSRPSRVGFLVASRIDRR